MSLGKLQKGYFSSARKIFFHFTVIVGHKESTQSMEKAFKIKQKNSIHSRRNSEVEKKTTLFLRFESISKATELLVAPET